MTYSYDRRAVSEPRNVEKSSDLPKIAGALISYQVGGGFSTRYWQAIRTKSGWLKAGLQLKGQLYFAKPRGPDKDIEQGSNFQVLAEGVKPGGRILHPAQLEGFGPGSMVEAKDGSTFIRKGDVWVPDKTADARQKAREQMNAKPTDVRAWHFEGEVKQGLKVKQAK